ncbi:hypothetical protein amrb99_85980 [Actinomadura sp. RB99]|nr:hypothetical protein [Actinomadura sp. RB99]
MGAAGTAAARAQTLGPTLGMDQATAHRRYPMAGACRCAVAGRACLLGLLASGVLAVPPLATRRHLGDHPGRAASTGRGCRADGRQAGVDSTVLRAHQHSAGGRRLGDKQAEPPGGRTPEPDDHALGRSQGGLSTKLHLACGQSRCRWWSPPGSGATLPSSRWTWPGSESPALAAGTRAPGLSGRAQTRLTRPGRSGLTCGAGASRPRSPNRPTRPATDGGAGTAVAGRPGSIRSTTASAMRWSAASTGSNATGHWPPGSTSSPSATRSTVHIGTINEWL